MSQTEPHEHTYRKKYDKQENTIATAAMITPKTIILVSKLAIPSQIRNSLTLSTPVLNNSTCRQKRAKAGAILGWVTSLGSFHPGNRRQNRELLVGKADNIGDRRGRMLQNGIRDTPVLHGMVGKPHRGR
ncbi:hypothetical protein E3N88_41156 [Mikania micrantha]|uniref:Uncharacterized protein n=1 Tax=Mikania micrantha TaxID=192012 RepID=A0A5N6LPR5_9ASTR|nr:hypothetical protein E3N88_41156 [Mikania micrantha]